MTNEHAAAQPSKPFLKWAGGKRKLLPQILPYVPLDFRAYHEPFLGGGALFFHLPRPLASLSDTNEQLIRTYRAVRDNVNHVIAILRSWEHSKEQFLAIRAIHIESGSAVPDAYVAARLIYLNKTCFNGLYRVNKSGKFNAPFGNYKNPTICDEDALRSASEALQCVALDTRDFSDVLHVALPGDFVYFDPPYVPLNVSSSFTGYTQDGFGFEDQLRLRDVAVELKTRGVKVLLSNSIHPIVRELYSNHFTLTEVLAARSINCDGGGRGKITELLIH